MAQDIVGSLFGMNQQPDYSAQDYRTAVAMAEMNNPNQMGRFLGGMIGAPVGRAVAQGIGGLLGVEDPRLQQAAAIREAQQQGFDVTTPEGLQQLAQFFVQKGQPGLASQVAQQVQSMQQTAATTRRTEQQAAREEQRFKLEDQLRTELANLGPNPTEEQVISVVTKYGDPTQVLKILETKQTKMAAEEGTAVGPVGKAGAFRDAEGNVRGSAEMAKVRAGYSGAQELMNMLNKITVDDVSAAYSPIGVDWTTKEGWQKKLAGAGTVDAQSKIAVAKLEEVISNLPPGAASDADMKQALSGFPGFGDRVALANWISRAKEKIQFILDGFSSNYGWKPRVRSSGALNLEGQQQTQQPTETGNVWRLK